MSEWSKLSDELNIYIPQLSFEKIYEYIVEPKMPNMEHLSLLQKMHLKIYKTNM